MIELLIGIAVGAIFVIGAATAIVPSLKIGSQATTVQEQAQLGQELLDNIKAWSNGNWSSVLSLATGTANHYYLSTATSPFTPVAAGSVATVYAGYFDGTDNYVNFGTLNLLPAGAGAVSAWVKMNTTSVGNNYVVSYGNDAGSISWGLDVFPTDAGHVTFCLLYGSARWVCSSSLAIAPGNWHLYTAVMNSNGTQSLYVDGALVASGSDSVITPNSSNNFNIGKTDRSAPYQYFTTGVIDDVRIYSTSLSSSSVQSIYAGSPPSSGLLGEWNFEQNANDSSGNSHTGTWGGTPSYSGSYYAPGIVGPAGSTGGGTSESISSCPSTAGGNGIYAYSKTITISPSQVSSGDQTNFPMLFSGTYSYLATTANGGKVTNSSGNDIIFTSDAAGTNILPFEQESYNPITGAVNYWIKIPTLSHSHNTSIYMFYGDANATTSQANAAGVWTNSYSGVYHLPNGTTLSANDSTGNGNNGTNYGGTATTGEIGGGAAYNGSNQYTVLPRSISNDFTISAWFNTTYSGSAKTNGWYSGAQIVERRDDWGGK